MKDKTFFHFGGIAVMGLLGAICALCLVCDVFILLMSSSPPRSEPEIARLPRWRTDTVTVVPSASLPLPDSLSNPSETVVETPELPAETGSDTTNPPEETGNIRQDSKPVVTPLDDVVNLYTGPGSEFEVFGVLPVGQVLEIVGRNLDSTWWQVTSPNGVAWVEASSVTTQNVDANIAIVDDSTTSTTSQPDESLESDPEQQTPSGSVPLDLIEVTSPVSLGSQAMVTIETIPGAECSIAVSYNSSRSEADGLAPKIAGADGHCSWIWQVDPDTQLGNWRLEIAASANGQRNVVSGIISIIRGN